MADPLGATAGRPYLAKTGPGDGTVHQDPSVEACAVEDPLGATAGRPYHAKTGPGMGPFTKTRG